MHRFKEALKTDEFKDVKPEWAHELYESFHQLTNFNDGSDSWYETSSDSHGAETCEGDHNINWKDNGYGAVFDLLQVQKFDHSNQRIRQLEVNKLFV